MKRDARKNLDIDPRVTVSRRSLVVLERLDNRRGNAAVITDATDPSLGFLERLFANFELL